MRNLWPGFFISGKGEKWACSRVVACTETRSDPCAGHGEYLTQELPDWFCGRYLVDCVLFYDLGRKRKVGLLNDETQWFAPLTT